MPIKVSEKKLFAGIVCFAVGIFLLFNTQLIKTPVHISEAGILLIALSICLITFGVFLFKRSAMRF